jgi:hypothetical protein
MIHNFSSNKNVSEYIGISRTHAVHNTFSNMNFPLCEADRDTQVACRGKVGGIEYQGINFYENTVIIESPTNFAPIARFVLRWSLPVGHCRWGESL